jgi:hypothetical protein
LPLNTLSYLSRLEYFQHVISNFLCSTDCSRNKHAASIFRFEGTRFMLMVKLLESECGSIQIAASAIMKIQWPCWQSNPTSQVSLINLHNCIIKCWWIELTGCQLSWIINFKEQILIPMSLDGSVRWWLEAEVQCFDSWKKRALAVLLQPCSCRVHSILFTVQCLWRLILWTMSDMYYWPLAI